MTYVFDVVEQRSTMALFTVQRGSACTRSEPRPLGAKCSVTLALERVTIANPFCLFVGPPTEEASLLLGTDNIRFASCVPF